MNHSHHYLLFLILVYLASPLIGVDKEGALLEIYRPQSLVVEGERIIIAQGAQFKVFNRENLTCAHQFCQEGEGPGELKSLPMIPVTLVPFGRDLVGEGMGKIIRYSGENLNPIAEKKIRGMGWNILPAGDNLLVTRFSPNEGDRIKMELELIDGNQKRIGILHSQDTLDRDKEIIMFRDPIGYGVTDDRIVVEKSERQFELELFDFRGKRIGNIKKPDIEAQPISEAFKAYLMGILQSDPLIKTIADQNGGWESFRKMTTFTFPDKLPVIRDLKVKYNRIYIMTFTADFNRSRLIVMDLEGNVLKEKELPYPQSPFFTANALGKHIHLWDVSPTDYYYLDSDDEENWTLEKMEL